LAGSASGFVTIDSLNKPPSRRNPIPLGRPDVVTKAIGLKPAVYDQIVQDLIISGGAGAFIAFAIATATAAKVLQLRPLTFLGKISYSLYLYHLLTLVGMLHLFYGKLPIWQVYSLAFVVAMVVSTLSYYLIELPAIRRGKAWTRGSRRSFRIRQLFHALSGLAFATGR
jgi:peptidoglycan/LPS O-acetylase OafA/YrhL